MPTTQNITILGNFVHAAADVLAVVLEIYMLIVIVAAVLSWITVDPYNPGVRFLRGVTDPAFRLVRRLLPLPQTGIDFSPIIVILVIYFLQRFLVPTMHQVASHLP
ncbi:MAG: YggT family protein [Thermodesulfobacteriota bacterium]